VEGLTLGPNYLSIAVKAVLKNDEGLYRCTANNDLGVVVNSETQLIKVINHNVNYFPLKGHVFWVYLFIYFKILFSFSLQF